MRTLLLVCAIAFALSTSVQSQELERTHLFGTRQIEGQTRPKAVKAASWLDDDTIVYWDGNGTLICRELAADRIRWQRDIPSDEPHFRWSVSRGTQRLALVYEEQDGLFSLRTEVIDCGNGETLFAADAEQWKTILPGKAFHLPWQIVLTPVHGKLIVSHGYDADEARAAVAGLPADQVPLASARAYVLDETYTKLEKTLKLAGGGADLELTVSADDARICQAIQMEVISIHEIATNKEVFQHGKRLKQGEAAPTVTDVEFVSHVRHDGEDSVVFSVDGGWGPGTVHVRKLATDRPNVNAAQAKRDFDARNGHIEMDVDFQHERIALTGTSTNITLLSFAGEELVHLENAMPDRNACIEFSPSGDRLVVGCFDGTVAVFKLPTLPEPAKPSLTGKRERTRG